VTVCPGGAPTGYTYFIPQEELLESRVMTRGYMESRMVVLMAGRCAPRQPAAAREPLTLCRLLRRGDTLGQPCGDAVWSCVNGQVCQVCRRCTHTLCMLRGPAAAATRGLQCCSDAYLVVFKLHFFQGPRMRPPSSGLPHKPGRARRCAERMLLGEGRVSTAGANDLRAANNIAREMVYRCGFSRRLGPVSLMSNERRFLNDSSPRSVVNIGTELARIAMADVRDVRACLAS